MAEKKQKPLGDAEVMTRINQKVRQCVGWDDSKLMTERARVIKYYNSTLPLRQSKGSSSYVSTDVYDSVESMKAQLLETFAGNPDNLVSFPALTAQDVEECRIATEYCNHVVFRENDGYDIFSEVIHDGLTSRVGIAKVYWDQLHEDSEETFAGLSYQDVQSLAAKEDVSSFEANAADDSPDPTNPLFSGRLTRVVDRSRVAIDPIPPEEFLIEARAKKIAKAGLCSHRTKKTRAELLEMGLDPKKVELVKQDDGKGLEMSQESLERNAPVENLLTPDSDALQPETEKVILYETYARMDLHDGNGVKLYKILHSGEVLFEKEEVDHAPFQAFVPLPVPHMFHGNNFANRVVPTQNARTVLTRAILDHASITTNPRWGVIKGGLQNPKEMLDNRLGGIVNFTRPDAVKPLEQQPLNPFVFQTLEMLKTNKEESTGISALSQGLNKDAISTQNSQGLVGDLVQLSQTRQKIVARNFAYGFLIPLYLEVYRLVLLNEKKEKVIEVAGNYVPVSVEAWQERRCCKVALHLGYGERDRETAKYNGAYKTLASDPVLGPMFGPPQRYKLATDGLKSAGFENYAEYLADPKTITPPPPDPFKTRELDIREMEAKAQLITAQAGALKNEKVAEVAAMKEQLAELKMHMDAILKTREADRQDADVKNRIDVSQREMTLLEKQPVTTETGVVKP